MRTKCTLALMVLSSPQLEKKTAVSELFQPVLNALIKPELLKKDPWLSQILLLPPPNAFMLQTNISESIGANLFSTPTPAHEIPFGPLPTAPIDLSWVQLILELDCEAHDLKQHLLGKGNLKFRELISRAQIRKTGWPAVDIIEVNLANLFPPSISQKASKAYTALSQWFAKPTTPSTVSPAAIVSTTATALAAQATPNPNSRQARTRKIIFWCGSEEALLGTKLVEDVLSDLKKLLPNTSIQINKLGDVDTEPNADVLYFAHKICGGRWDIYWPDVAQSLLKIARNNCVWLIAAADGEQLKDACVEADLPASQLTDADGNQQQLKICFVCCMDDNFHLCHTEPEKVIGQILDAVRMKGWSDLIAKQVNPKESYSSQLKR